MLPKNPDDKMVLGETTLLVNTCPIVPTNFVCSDSESTARLIKQIGTNWYFGQTSRQSNKRIEI